MTETALQEYIAEQENTSHWTGRMPKYQALVAEAVAHGAGLLADRAGVRVLDVGCGDGWSLDEWQNHGCEAIGLDVSLPKVQAARRDGRSVVWGIVGRDAFVWPREAFDLVFCSHTLEHLPEDWLANGLAEMRRVLRCDGRGLIVVPYGHKKSPGHVTYFDREDKLPALLAAAGFTVDRAWLRERLEPEQWIELSRS